MVLLAPLHHCMLAYCACWPSRLKSLLNHGTVDQSVSDSPRMQLGVGGR
jgi:hypothetical protein